VIIAIFGWYSLSSNGRRTLLVNLKSEALKPEEWGKLADEKPCIKSFADISIYELHIRDFRLIQKFPLLFPLDAHHISFSYFIILWLFKRLRYILLANSCMRELLLERAVLCSALIAP